jgi:branched-chain amino acid transport system ATP-binding protein
MLSVRNLTVRYGSAIAVRGVSLEVGEHEAVALLGANGAGKTSTLLGIVGAVSRSGQTITFGGQDISGAAPHENARRGLIEVPEGRQLFPDLSVDDNLLLGAYSRRSRKTASEARAYVLDLLPALRPLLKNRAQGLSGGEQQMVAIGRALMSRPNLLMLDEPSLGLSPALAARLYQTLAAIRANGVSMLVVEQNVPLALSVCERGYVLSGGAIVLAGPREDLLFSDELKSAYLGSTASRGPGRPALIPPEPEALMPEDHRDA